MTSTRPATIDGHCFGAVVLLAATALVTLTLIRGYDVAGPVPNRGESNVTAIMAADGTAGFSRVEAVQPFKFPRDHGSHPDYRSEWWYFTGQLGTAGRQRAYGFQLTFFRYALAPHRIPSVSRWRTPTIIMAHFALTDFESGTFHAEERLFRALPTVAGISAEPFQIWLDDWRIEHQMEPHGSIWEINGRHAAYGLDLKLRQLGSEVLQGESGMSRKGAGSGDASYYYSVPRLSAHGTVEVDGQRHPVEGLAWLDREWSTSALGRNQQGWDWFALHLADGRSLMFYQLRRQDGSKDPFSAGSLTAASGESAILSAEDVTIKVTGYWTSPETGTTYPNAWHLLVPGHDLHIALQPYVKNQEWTGRFKYWEGAVQVFDMNRKTATPLGAGYVELTGYDSAR